MNKLLMLSILTLAACNMSPRSRGSAPPPSGPIQTEIGLRGTHADGYRAVLLDIKDLRVVADGQALTVTPGQTRLELGDDEKSFTIGTVVVPRDARNVQVSVVLDDAGAFERKDEAGDIDARSVPLQFTTNAAELAQHARADIALDLGRSLIARSAERRILIPNLSVRY